MARDAITRQYDVDKNLTTLTCADGKDSYRPGVITFYSKKGRSLDLARIRDSITATRLSGGTGMGVEYLEITAFGNVEPSNSDLLFKVAGTGQQFLLKEAPSAKGQVQKMRDALDRGEKISTVIGRVEGWNGVFPVVLRELAKAPEIQTLYLIDFKTNKK